MAISIDNFSFSTFLSVDFGDSSGSGFRLIIDGQEYIITAKHVVFNKGKLLSDLWIKSRNYFGNEEESYSAKVDLRPENVFLFENIDAAIIKLDKECNYTVENDGNNISFSTLDDIIFFDAISIASNILLVGFPSSLTVDDFYEVDRPLLRTGIVAGKNVKNQTFIIDSLAYYGVSGGPVVRIDTEGNLHILGIVSRFVPFITEWKNKHEMSLSRQDFYNSGYAVCIPMDAIVNKIKNWKA